MLKRIFTTACAATLLLFAFIFVAGTIKLFRHPEPGGSAADWIIPGLLAIPCAAGGGALAWRVRPPLTTDLFLWPSVQALVLYAGAFPLMGLVLSFAQVVAFGAFCVFCVSAPVSALLRPRWTTTAISALVSGLLLFGALTQTAENLFGERLGEGGMVYLLPMSALPVLLLAVGVVRIARRSAGLRAAPGEGGRGAKTQADDEA